MYMKLKIFLCLIFIETFCTVKAQNLSDNDLTDRNCYDYAVRPGTEEWKSMSYSQRLSACQLPDDTLSSISTARLLNTCLIYPYNIDIFSFDDGLLGFSKIRSWFNGYSALFQRSDIAGNIITLYSSRNPNYITGMRSSREQGRYSIEYYILELMLVQPETINSANDSQSEQIVKMLLNKLDKSELLPNYYSRMDYDIVCLARGRYLQRIVSFPNYNGNTLLDFLNDGKVRNTSDLDYIINEARKI